MENLNIDPQRTETQTLSDRQLEELSKDKRNRVYRADHEEVREPWDMAKAIPLFKTINATFAAHCAAFPNASDSDDARARASIERDGSADVKRVIGDHPTLFAKLTDRSVIVNPVKTKLLWMMIELHAATAAGEISVEDAQRQFATAALPNLRN